MNRSCDVRFPRTLALTVLAAMLALASPAPSPSSRSPVPAPSGPPPSGAFDWPVRAASGLAVDETGGDPGRLPMVRPVSSLGSLAQRRGLTGADRGPGGDGGRPATEPARQRLVISAAGDTNLDPGYLPVFREEGYEYAFAGLDGIFVDDDLTIVNLECAASTVGAPVSKTFTFNCDVDSLPVMVEAGVDVANLANNHSADWGVDALLETRDNVARAGLSPVGVGVDAGEANQPALVEVNGWTVAVVGFGGVVPGADWLATDDSPGMADGDTVASMVAAVKRADELADLVLVTIHWGVELDTTPRPDDIERAHAMIDAGADAVFGHHPHRLQPLEFYRGKPIAWSLGNFVWPRLSDAGATTAVARVIVEPDGTMDACLIPTFIERSGQPVLQGPHRQGCRPYRSVPDDAS